MDDKWEQQLQANWNEYHGAISRCMGYGQQSQQSSTALAFASPASRVGRPGAEQRGVSRARHQPPCGEASVLRMAAAPMAAPSTTQAQAAALRQRASPSRMESRPGRMNARNTEALPPA